MSKYKLIKIYPKSPPLGTIVEIGNDGYLTYRMRNDYNQEITSIHKSVLTDYPEFWEEIVEKDYEILSYGEGFDESKKSLGKEIRSVKRLSDGVVFAVGDKINIKHSINRFEIGITKDILVYIDEGSKGWIDFRSITKAKQHLFTTEDGVDIYEGDKYFQLALTFYPVFREAIYEEVGRSNINYSYAHNKGRECLNKNGRYYFSTKEAAEGHILMNKPCLSINDLVNQSTHKTLIEELKNLVKSKL